MRVESDGSLIRCARYFFCCWRTKSEARVVLHSFSRAAVVHLYLKFGSLSSSPGALLCPFRTIDRWVQFLFDSVPIRFSSCWVQFLFGPVSVGFSSGSVLFRFGSLPVGFSSC